MIGAIGYGGMAAMWQQAQYMRGAAAASGVAPQQEGMSPVSTITAAVGGAAASAVLTPSEMPYIPEGYGPEELATRTRLQYPEPDTPLANALQGKLDGLEDELEQETIHGVEGEEDKLPAGMMEEEECETCENRMYQDGSDDPGVSFKTATKLSPEEAVSAVRGHEQEHVVRERAKAEREGRKVVSQSVTIQTSVCPECGRVYVSGGVTRTVTVPDENAKNGEVEGSQGIETEQADYQATA